MHLFGLISDRLMKHSSEIRMPIDIASARSGAIALMPAEIRDARCNTWKGAATSAVRRVPARLVGYSAPSPRWPVNPVRRPFLRQLGRGRRQICLRLGVSSTSAGRQSRQTPAPLGPVFPIHGQRAVETRVVRSSLRHWCRLEAQTRLITSCASQSARAFCIKCWPTSPRSAVREVMRRAVGWSPSRRSVRRSGTGSITKASMLTPLTTTHVTHGAAMASHAMKRLTLRSPRQLTGAAT